MAMDTYSFRIDSVLIAAVDRIAQEEGRTRGDIIRRFIANGVSRKTRGYQVADPELDSPEPLGPE